MCETVISSAASSFHVSSTQTPFCHGSSSRSRSLFERTMSNTAESNQIAVADGRRHEAQLAIPETCMSWACTIKRPASSRSAVTTQNCLPSWIRYFRSRNANRLCGECHLRFPSASCEYAASYLQLLRLRYEANKGR